MYSFIRPQKKNIISKLSKIWIFYILASVAIMVGYMGVVEAEKLYMTIQTEENIARKQEYQAQIARAQAELGIAQDQSAFANQIQAQNARITKTILSLFDLTPDQITLHSIEMHRDRLIIKGVTPSKEIYNFLLEAPLRSIFNESRVDFFPLANGWFNFVSVSRTFDLNLTEEQQ